MTTQAPPPDRASRPVPKYASITVKTTLLVVVPLLLTALALLAFFVPRTRQQFDDRTEDLLLTSHDGMNGIATSLIESHQDVVLDLATNISDSYASELADLPLRLAGGDEAKIRNMILAQVSDLRRRTIRNVEIIGEELRLRSETDVGSQMEEQRRLQKEKGRQFGTVLQRQSVPFVLLLVLAPVPLLLAGLYRMLVRPLVQLAGATARARSGDLDFEVAVTSRDEVGSLQTSFNRMIADLSTSRRRIEDWNTTLEQTVDEKTAALTSALAEQRATTQQLEATVSELREAQGQLIHAEKMASLGNLAASLAHEFNNLLGGILGSAEAALEDTPDGTAREALEVVRRAARRACGITDNLLRFSRKEESRKQPADLHRLVDETRQLVEAEMAQRSIECVVDAGEIPLVPLDSGQMHQVFLNLFSNAIAAIDRDGAIHVTTEARDDSVRIVFADDGPGVAPEDRQRIFEPFYTSRAARRGDKRQGTGLGLSVSYGIVTAHGGSIEVDERPGGGARFTIDLPLDNGGAG